MVENSEETDEAEDSEREVLFTRGLAQVEEVLVCPLGLEFFWKIDPVELKVFESGHLLVVSVLGLEDFYCMLCKEAHISLHLVP